MPARLICRPVALLFSVMLIVAGVSHAEEPTKAAGFRQLVQTRQRALMQEVIAYVQQNPGAADADAARHWILETAISGGLEDIALSTAVARLSERALDADAANLARRVQCLGLAKSGQINESLSSFDELLRGARFQAANRTLDFAHQLSVQARLNGDLEASRAVYERLVAAFPINPVIAEIAETRMAKIGLIGKPSPPFSASDTTGEAVELAEFSDKVLILDFWATNCPPCIEELPQLKALHDEFHPHGLEIVGVSLDERVSEVEEFKSRRQLPWRMVMNEQPAGRLQTAFRVVTIPSLFLIDQKGNVVNVDLYGGNLRAAVAKLLPGKE